MITIILLIVCLCISVCTYKDESAWTNKSNSLIAAFGSFTCGLIMSLAVVFLLGVMFTAEREVSRVNMSVPIYSLRNSDGINGSFLLGSGSIDTTEYYYTFTRDDRGGYERVRVPTHNCYLFQDENNKPYMSWQVITYCPSKWLYIGPGPRWTDKTKYDIHVPENTIIQKYEVR